jgi:dimethylargininase
MQRGRIMVALTREVSPTIDWCELTHLSRQPIDLARAQAQHTAFEQALVQLGCTIRRVPPAPDLPDAVFVQDAALVFDEVGVITRPGAESRRAETTAVAAALQSLRPLRFIESPATLDGGDVVCLGRSVVVGRTARTNAEGARQLADILGPFGYAVRTVTPTGCLHLQTAVTPVADHVVLVNRAWIDPSALSDFEVIDVDPAEPFAANALRVEEAIVYPAAFPRTRARLEARGLRVVPVDMSELAKAEAGVTCCCILVP